MFSLLNNKTVQLNGSLLGFENLNEFHLSILGEGSPFAFLQSKEDEHIGFLVTTPFTFFDDYAFEMEEKDKQRLNVIAPEDVFVLTIVTLRDPLNESTVNLLAPIAVNVKSLSAVQIVLPPHSKYETKTPLYDKATSEGGEE